MVFARGSGLTAADLAAVASARDRRGAPRRACRAGSARPARCSGRPTGKAAAFTANVTAPADNQTSADTTAVQAIRQAVGRAGQPRRRRPAGRRDRVGRGERRQQRREHQTSCCSRRCVIMAVILLLVYRSPVLWLLPLLGASRPSIVAEAAAHGLANAGLTVSTLSADILTVLVLGAASDYALLLIHRYREELRHHAAAEDAMAAALRRDPAHPAGLRRHRHLRHDLPADGAVGLPARPRPGRRRRHRRRPARPDHLPARAAPRRRAGGVLAPRPPPGSARPRGLPALGGHRRPGRPPPRAGRPGRRGAPRRGVRRPRRPAHRQRPRGRRERPSRQRHRRAAARRALPGRGQRPADHPGPAARGARPPRRGAGHAGSRHRVAGRPVGGYASYSVILSVPPYGASGHSRNREPAQPPRPRRARLAGGRRPGHPVRHQPVRPATTPWCSSRWCSS